MPVSFLTAAQRESYGRYAAAPTPDELALIYVQLAASDVSYATGQIYGASDGDGQP